MRIKSAILSIFLLALMAFNSNPSSSYKCLIQLKNYEGEGAYVVVSVVNQANEYQKTLQVLGDDSEWYKDLPQWYAHWQKKTESIDAITGATIGGGERAIKILEIPTHTIDAGFKLRFETAVEDQDYFATDLEFELTKENLKQKQEGKGYIRYVRLLEQK
ncbi:DUF2271 domain-containing protein [uncultured Mesonia sp.]|uniref:DUF2271 domain-containing protein n=1 Tax=uncultured Mesonia sp. TaxID=399731 RepID=UPI00374E9424